MPDAFLSKIAEQIVSRCRELASITDVPGETTRTFLSPATHAVHALLTAWMQAAGLVVTIDPIGNLHGLTPDCDDAKPRLLIGSHIDTVVDAGAFDGLLGILLGIALVDLLRATPLPFAMEVVAFSEEEGVRFGQPCLGSLALIGEPVPATVTDQKGSTIAQAVEAYGHTSTAPALLSPAAFAYLEFHIEQGPVLASADRPLAAVCAIAGQTRLYLVFAGQANHAGTTPMPLRHDALAAAAQWITTVEACALTTRGLVATVGSITVAPNVGNIIPAAATLSLDLRHEQDPVRQSAFHHLVNTAQSAAHQRGVTCNIETLLDQPAVQMDPALTAKLVFAAASCGHDAQPMPSGAGHDAMILARRVPAAMLFLRSPGGLSHHPAESVMLADVEAALATGLTFLRSVRPDFASPTRPSQDTHA